MSDRQPLTRASVCDGYVEGVVLKEKNGRFTVRIEGQGAACNGCKACALHKNRQTVTAKAAADCAAGDRVLLKAPPSRPLFAILLLLVLPIACMGGGMGVGYAASLSEPLWFLAGVLGLAAGFVPALLLDRLVLSEKNRYTIVGRY
ncbi:MAG: SoxR reducing system RseC family protein [Clostridiales bacterium]|jgi:positive regulator of sigma E activity|nr:SoxR reducing system RseC family protein [Clostridiales bacterium]